MLENTMNVEGKYLFPGGQHGTAYIVGLTNIRHTSHCFLLLHYYPTAPGHRVLALMFVCSGIQIQNFSLSLPGGQLLGL